MEIRYRPQESGPILAAVFALIILGVASLYLTWQSIEHQRSVVKEHMVLSGGVIVRGVESNLFRMVRGMRAQSGKLGMDDRLLTVFQEYFQELTESDELAFVALYGPDGKLMVGSMHEDEQLEVQLPKESYRALMRQGRWDGLTTFQGKSVLAVGLQARPGMASTCGMGHGRGRGPGMGRSHRPDFKQPHGQDMDLPRGEPALFFVVGISAERHMTQFRLFRRAALLQTGYVLGAAVVLWLLAFAYLKRRSETKQIDRMERFQSKLLDNMPDGLVTLSDTGEIMAANPSATRLLDPNCLVDGPDEGCPVTGHSWSEFSFGAENSPLGWQQHDYHGRKLEMLCVPFAGADESDPEDASSPMVTQLILIRDRTQLRSLEEDLVEAKRLATIGSLAAGVAHEVRNPLSSLRGFAQLFASKFKGNAPYDEYAATMVKEADRLNRVVTDLLYLARPRPVEVDSIELSPAVEGLIGLMRFDLEHKKLIPQIDLQARTVCADSDALTQVLMNLVTNALDAVPEDDGQIHITSRTEDETIVISVEDNGPGIPEEDRTQALEPFYTTKKKGTGLGLAIVHTILRGHRGRVTVGESSLGGAKVELYFPETCGTDKE